MKKHNRRMPAEWEHQSCVQLTWPHEDTDWAPMLPEITAVYEEIAREISKREDLLIVAPESVQPNVLLSEVWRCEQRSTSNVHRSPFFVQCPTNDTWARDHGFITVEEDEGLVLLDFCFNGWGEKFPADLDNAINRHLYDNCQQSSHHHTLKERTDNCQLLNGKYEDHLDFVLEGGSIESDGRGTIFTTSCCLLAPHRNQPLSQQEIEDRLKEWLGAERIVWLNHGSLIGDDTDGHIDTLVRICPNDTLLYMGGDDDHPDLAEMEKELQALRTLDGRPYRLLKLPLPRPIFSSQFTPPHARGENYELCTMDYEPEDRLPATYANYLIINGAVLVPTYSQPDLDAEALRIIGLAFPDREIVGIDCRAIIRQHGSLHCCTIQYY